MANSKPKVLIFSDYYVPGYKWGGSIRSILNLVDALGDECEFRVVTSDHDQGDTQPYRNVMLNSWQQIGKAQVFYMSRRRNTVFFLRDLVRTTPHDVLYLNSFFSPKFSIVPMLLIRFGMMREKTVIVAPRGEFSAGALAVKAWKKRLYIYASKTLSLHRGVTWHVSNEREGRDVSKMFNMAKLQIAGDLTALKSDEEERELCTGDYFKTRGALRAVFLSRISPKKNLDGALAMLRQLRGQVSFTIYGALEDRKYWQKCQSIIESLPGNVRVKYGGVIAHDQVIDVMEQYHLLVFPTHGENFGHVIMEALIAGCAILTSDQTPWRDLEVRGVGWNLPLGEKESFRKILQHCIDMESEEFQVIRRRAREYGREKARDQKIVQQNRELLGCLQTSSW